MRTQHLLSLTLALGAVTWSPPLATAQDGRREDDAFRLRGSSFPGESEAAPEKAAHDTEWIHSNSSDPSAEDSSTRRRTSVFSVPHSLQILGMTLLGPQGFEDVYQAMQAPETLVVMGRTLVLTQDRNDNSIQRLRDKFEGQSSYGHLNVQSHTPLLLDIGGNIGCNTILMSKLFHASQVVVFEPSPQTYFYLRVNLWLNDINVLTSEELQHMPYVPGVYPVMGGVSGAHVPFTLARSVANEFGSQNVITVDDPNGSVAIYGLKHFLAHHHLLKAREFDVIKIDCECCEYSVIPGNKEVFLSAKHVVGEIHGCGRERAAQREMMQILQDRGCRFEDKNFDQNGNFIDTASLSAQCS